MAFLTLPAVAIMAAGLPADVPPADAPAPKAASAETVLQGRLVDERGEGVAGATIKLYAGMGTRFLAQSRVTPADGSFTFDPMIAAGGFGGESGSFGFVVEHPNLARADGLTWEEIAVKRGQRLAHDVVMTRAGWAEVLILDSAGQLGRSLDLKIVGEGGQVRHATCGGDGVLVIAGLRPGRYRLEENNSGRHFPQMGELTIRAGELTRATLKHPEDLRARPENGKHAN